jgi:hypothetical protein
VVVSPAFSAVAGWSPPLLQISTIAGTLERAPPMASESVGASAPNAAISNASQMTKGWRKRWKFIWTGRMFDQDKADYLAGTA